MFFTSYEFIGFFFLLLLLYYLAPKKLQWIILLIASGLFYYAASPVYLFYIAATTLLSYGAARVIEANLRRQKAYLKENKEILEKEQKKAYKNAQGRIRKRWFLLGLIPVLGILIVTKYTNFFIANFNQVSSGFGGWKLSFVTLIVPMGISFYTFQAVGYLADVYRETIPAEKNFLRYALFISFFPQLIQGPISRYGDLAPSLLGEHVFEWGKVRNGLFRMLWGFFKKMVVADRILVAVSTMIKAPESYRGAYAAVAMLFYTIDLYADFTGGIDITIGAAQALGIDMKENFVRPYFSFSLKEYWRRWHITMCTWFKDYVFYPVSTSGPIMRIAKITRKHLGEKAGKRIPVYLSTLIVWLATGIWHGASWNFVVWGLLNWGILMISEELDPLYTKFHARFGLDKTKGYRLFMIIRTFVLICVLNLFDCFTDVSTTVGMILSVFGAHNWEIVTDGSLLALGLGYVDYILLGIGILIMLSVSLVQCKGPVRERIARLPYAIQVTIWFGLFLAVLLFGRYGIGYDSSQFIYNQF